MSKSLSFTFLVTFLIIHTWALTGNSTCRPGADDLDWYTDIIGETPCRTFERLRQQCNSTYQVGSSTLPAPGFRCDDQCCCNSVAFYLSMLCMNCQWNLNSSIGFDSPRVGSYGIYLDSCSPVTNQSLPHDVQDNVCQNGIKIIDSLYRLFWVDGRYFYRYTKDSILDHWNKFGAAGSFSHCNTTGTITSPLQTSTSSSTTTSTTTTNSFQTTLSNSFQTSSTTTTATSSSLTSNSDDNTESDHTHRIALIVSLVCGLAALTVIIVFFGIRLRRKRALKVERRASPFVVDPPCDGLASSSPGPHSGSDNSMLRIPVPFETSKRTEVADRERQSRERPPKYASGSANVQW